MDQLINFRANIETFTEVEFDSFCNKLYKQYNERSLIIKSLFFLLLDETKHNLYQNVNNVYQITKGIMDLRRKNSKSNKNLTLTTADSDKSNDISIHHLASSLISNISCYLRLPDQTSLLQCNRFIFSSLTSSVSRIQTLMKPNWIYRYKETYGPQLVSCRLNNLNKLSRAKQVHLSQIVEAIEPYELLPWNNLDMLRLGNYLITSSSINGLDKTIEFVNAIKLKHLWLQKCDVYSHLQSTFEINKLFELIHANPKIECLSLIECSIIISVVLNVNDLINNNNLSKLNNLKSLILKDSGMNLMDGFLSIYGTQLSSLHLSVFLNSTYEAINNKYSNLKELCLENVGDELLINQIIQTATKLERFHWKITDGISDNVKIILQIILEERPNMEYLSIKSPFSVFQYLNNKSFEKLKRNNMKIRWSFFHKLNAQHLKFIENNISDFINELNKCVINDFMCILEINVGKHNFDGIQNELNVMGKSYNIRIGHAHIFKKIVISNKGCKMCGYREQWLYSCTHCNYCYSIIKL